MKIAITGAQGEVGREVVKLCAQAGHSTVQIDRTDAEYDGTPNSETKTADTADYDAIVDAFRGCDAVIHLAAIRSPRGIPDSIVHGNNVQSSFNAFRACGELGVKRICYVSSVNAVGLVYSNQPLRFKYFPLDEDCPQNPTDSYALAKQEAEVQAKAFVNWFPGTKIACLRMHQVAPREQVQEEHEQDWEGGAVRNLWGYVHPWAAARACLLSIQRSNNFQGCEVFNIVAPHTTQAITSKELAQKHFPDTETREGLEDNKAFWTTEKAQRILGWEHEES